MVRVVLVVRSPWPAHVVGMIDGRRGSIVAEVPVDEGMMSVDVSRNYMTDQSQMVDEAVAYSMKGQEIERVTALAANHTSHFDEAVETRRFGGGRQNLQSHEGREGRENHDWLMPKVAE